MNMDYLKGRLEHAKALEADVVKVDIEEFASVLAALEQMDNLKVELWKKNERVRDLEEKIACIR